MTIVIQYHFEMVFFLLIGIKRTKTQQTLTSLNVEGTKQLGTPPPKKKKTSLAFSLLHKSILLM
jgi:hypothetical protein